VLDFVDDSARSSHDELDHHTHDHKSAQVAHYDRSEGEEFEITRPHGAPRLYRFFLDEKLRRTLSPIRSPLAGASALAVCGGSGMDAEYLARAGLSVISSDLSIGAATRTIARSSRYEVPIQSIVADVEHLPFDDQSVDLVAVHDGLHHLTDPYAGLTEMARVARRWITVTEPARASITWLAIRVGLAQEREAAGNPVARLDPASVARLLEEAGFVVLRAERYAMYYPQQPGRMFAVLSHPLAYPVVRAWWSAANALVGRFGNKLVVVAERAHGGAPSAATSRGG